MLQSERAPTALDDRVHAIGSPRLLTAALLALASATFFMSTLHPGVGGGVNHGDSAKFQFLGVVPGVSHAPGNPLYLLLLAIVQQVPLGTPALRANLLSASCAALCVGLMAAACHRIAGIRAAVLASVSLSVGGVFWGFATEAEVYALAGVFVALVLYALSRAEVEREGFWFGAALGAFALGIANHMSLVFALPGLAVACWKLWAAGVRPTRGSLLLAAGCSALTLTLYALFPVLDAHSVYSEYLVEPTFAGLIEYVTAAKWRPNVSIPDLQALIVARPLQMLGVMLRQWMLPIWLAAPLAFYALVRRAPASGWFLALAALGWAIFMLEYDIPDPDGFLVPIVCAIAPALGIAVQSSVRPMIATVLLVLALAPTLVHQQRVMRDRVGYDLLEDVGFGGPEREPLDLPDIIRRMPNDSMLVMPEGHYGCVQVSNYYRFADPEARARRIEVVRLRGGNDTSYPSSAPVVPPEVGKERVVCTVHQFEERLLAAAGARTRTEARGSFRLQDRDIERLPLYCTVP